jgi:transcriptional regulator with XRE-family HTH domain
MSVAKPRVTDPREADTPFAAAVRTIRFSLKWSQERLADALEVDRVTVARWEGAKAEPEPRTRRILAQLAQEHGFPVPDGLGVTTDSARPHATPAATGNATETQLLEQIRQLPEDRRVELLVQLVRENALHGKS